MIATIWSQALQRRKKQMSVLEAAPGPSNSKQQKLAILSLLRVGFASDSAGQCLQSHLLCSPVCTLQ